MIFPFSRSSCGHTVWGREDVAVLLTPAHWVDVRGGGIAPVVVHVLPGIKVDQEATLHQVRHGGHADERGVLLVNGLQLHALAEALRGQAVLGEEGTKREKPSISIARALFPMVLI